MIQITQTPAQHSAVFAPIIISGTCSRSPYTVNMRETAIITQFTNSGGRVGLMVDYSAYFEVGDSVSIRGATGSAQHLNGRHAIFSISGNLIVLSTLYSGVPTGGGVLVRQNDGLRVSVDVIISGTSVGAVEVQPLNKTWTADVSKVLAGRVSSFFALTPGNISAANIAKASVNYTLQFTERFLQADWTPWSGTSGGSYTGVAHRAADISGQQANIMPCTYMATKGGIVLTWLDPGIPTKAAIYSITAQGWGAHTVLTPPEVNGRRGCVYYPPPLAVGVVVYIIDRDLTPPPTPPVSTAKDVVNIRIPNSNTARRLYWLNSKGGYCAAEAVEFEIVEKAEKINGITVDAWHEVTYVLPAEAGGRTQYFEDILTSGEVRDERGNLVSVISTQMPIIAGEVMPSVTFKQKRHVIA